MESSPDYYPFNQSTTTDATSSHSTSPHQATTNNSSSSSSSNSTSPQQATTNNSSSSSSSNSTSSREAILGLSGDRRNPTPTPTPTPNPPLPSPPSLLDNQLTVAADKLAAMELVRNPPAPAQNSELVARVIEAAQSTLQDQFAALCRKKEENERLHSALRMRDLESQNHQIRVNSSKLENSRPQDMYYQAGKTFQQIGNPGADRPYGLLQKSTGQDMQAENAFSSDSQNSIILHPASEQRKQPANGHSELYYDLIHGLSGSVKTSDLTDGRNCSQISSNFSSSIPPRSLRDSDPELRFHLGGQALPNSLPDMSFHKGFYSQDMLLRSSSAHEEIRQLRKLLQEAQIKEMQLVQENRILEKRAFDLHLTIDHYQKQLVEAASRAVSIRNEVVEENARILVNLRAAERDLSLYTSSLLPLLAEFNLQPASSDAHSIVSGIKVLVQHLRASTATFSKGWSKDLSHPQQQWNRSPTQAIHEHGIIPHLSYSQPERPVSPISPLNPALRDWEKYSLANPYQNELASDMGSDALRHSPYLNPRSENQDGRSTPKLDYATTTARGNEAFHNVDEEALNNGSTLRLERHERGGRSPKLPTLLEERGSSASEEDDPLPAIEGLCINGEAIFGNKIGASGHSINGTTLCHFQWARYYQDGTATYIPGASQTDYTITTDDIGTKICLECTPMDDRNRKGRMIRVFAKEQVISLDAGMDEQIREYMKTGQAEFNHFLLMDSHLEGEYQSGLLTLKPSSYELKTASNRKIIFFEKYTAKVHIEVGSSTGNFYVAILKCGQDGNVFQLLFEEGRWRDLVVLTMREFIKGGLDRTRGVNSSRLPNTQQAYEYHISPLSK